jgi:hypothetical protein
MLVEIQQYYAEAELLHLFERTLAENRLRLLDAMQAQGISAVDRSSFEKVAGIVRANPSLRAAVENYWFFANRQIFLTRQLRHDSAALADKIERRYSA